MNFSLERTPTYFYQYNVVIITKLIGRTRQLLETMLDRVSRGLGSPFRQRVTCWPFTEPATSIYSVMVLFFIFLHKKRTEIITTNDIMHFYNVKKNSGKRARFILHSLCPHHTRGVHIDFVRVALTHTVRHINDNNRNLILIYNASVVTQWHHLMEGARWAFTPVLL